MSYRTLKRCAQCGEEYEYGASGEGARERLNDGTYCHSCKEVVLTALKAIPRHYECRYVNISEIPELAHIRLDQVLEWERWERWERKAEEQAQQQDGLQMRRVFPGMVNVKTGDCQNVREIRGVVDYKSYTFKVSTWTNKSEFSIEVPREYDLIEKRFTGLDWPHYKVRNRLITELLPKPIL